MEGKDHEIGLGGAFVILLYQSKWGATSNKSFRCEIIVKSNVEGDLYAASKYVCIYIILACLFSMTILLAVFSENNSCQCLDLVISSDTNRCTVQLQTKLLCWERQSDNYEKGREVHSLQTF